MDDQLPPVEIDPRDLPLLWQPPPQPRLGELLVAKGLITAEQLSEALAESEETSTMVGRVLVRRGWLFEDELARTVAEQLDLPYVNLGAVGVDRGAALRLPLEVGRRYAALPILAIGGRVRVAFADPTDADAERAVKEHIASPDVVVAELSEIDSTWRQIAAAR